MSSRPSFNKRHKEQARKEKQRLKAERKQQRKLEKTSDQTEMAVEAQVAVLTDELQHSASLGDAG